MAADVLSDIDQHFISDNFLESADWGELFSTCEFGDFSDISDRRFAVGTRGPCSRLGKQHVDIPCDIHVTIIK